MSDNRNVFEESAEVLAKVHQLVMDGDVINAKINEFAEHAHRMSEANTAANEALDATASNLKKSVDESHERIEDVIEDVTEALKELKSETQTARFEHQALLKELQSQATKLHDKQNELSKFVYLNLLMVFLFGLGTILFLALK